MHSFFTYVFLGISLAAPIGPVKATLINTGINKGFFRAWIFSLGALSSDILYMLLVYFGIAKFIDSPFMQTLLWSFGCFVLIYTGIENLLALHKTKAKTMTKTNRIRHTYIAGLFMAFLNPLTVLFWLGIYGSLLVGSSEPLAGYEIFICSGAILSGIMMVDLTMSLLSSSASKVLSNNILIGISMISSLSMIGFGVYFCVQAYHSLF